MSLSRCYQPTDLILQETIPLVAALFHHLIKVLRHQVGDQIYLFNGDGYDYLAELIEIKKQTAIVRVLEKTWTSRESPLKIHLGQVISRGDRMDFTIQKSVELGVMEITPLLSQHCATPLRAEHRDKKLQHWQAVAISACEQSGRNTIPLIHPPCALAHWLSMMTQPIKLILHPAITTEANALPAVLKQPDIALLVGPEGGFSADEVHLARQAHFLVWGLGPRILRTETAGLTAMSILQYQYGDLKS